MTVRLRELVSVAVVLALAAPMPAKAGFLDELANAIFGRPQSRPIPPLGFAPEDPLHVTVKPRRKRPVPEVASKPTPPVVKLDPQRDHDWYLKDPTLRRGDVVVTARGVLVYQGRDSDHMIDSDFTALGGRSGEKGWKGQLQAAAAGGRSFFRDFRDSPAVPADLSLIQPIARSDPTGR